MASTWMTGRLPLCSMMTSCCRSCTSQTRVGYRPPRLHRAVHGFHSPGSPRLLCSRPARPWRSQRRRSHRRHRQLPSKPPLHRRRPRQRCARYQSHLARQRGLLNHLSGPLRHLPRSQPRNLRSRLLQSSPPRIWSLRSLVPRGRSLVKLPPHLRNPERITRSRSPWRRGCEMTRPRTYCSSEVAPRT